MGDARDELLDRVMGEVLVGGITDRSLREIATAIGSSHRMLLYHFGTRAALVQAVVERVEADQRTVFGELAATHTDPAALVRALWQQVTRSDVLPFARLFFETVAFQATQPGRDRLTEPWLEATAPVAEQLGIGFDAADIRLGVAVTRGLLVDVLVTGEVDAATASLERFLELWPGVRPGTESRTPPPARPSRRRAG
jgi:AcrR family transcriptional regulator